MECVIVSYKLRAVATGAGLKLIKRPKYYASIRTMKKIWFLPLALTTLLVGCGDDENGDLSFDAYLEETETQIQGFLKIENQGDEAITITGSACPLMLRVYDGDEMVWDQGEESACIAVYTPFIVEPGQERELITEAVTDAEIMGDDLEPGKYLVSVYVVSPEYDGPDEFEAGEVELAKQD